MNAKFHQRRSAVLLLLALIVAGLSPPAAGQPDGEDGPLTDTAMLYWSNGDQLAGQLVGSDAKELRWQSPIFTSPFAIDIRYLRRVQFGRNSEDTRPEEAWRLITHGGDVFYGELVAIDDQHIVFQSQRHGRVATRRSAVQNIRRLEVDRLLDVGLASAAGWTTLRRQRNFNEWKTNEDGHLTTTDVGAELFRDLGLPAVSEVDLDLHWKGEPGFLITFAPPTARELPNDSVRLETWGDRLVLQSLAKNGDFKQILTLPPRPERLQLRLIWDQPRGELQVYSQYGRLMGKLATTQNTIRGYSAIYIQNKGQSFTLGHVRVSHMGGSSPASDTSQGYVQLKGGEIRGGRLTTYDAATKMLHLTDAADKERQIPIDKVTAVFLTDQIEPTNDEPGVRVSYHQDGARLSGKLRAIKDQHIVLDVPYSEQPIQSQLAGVKTIEFVNDATPDGATGQYLLEQVQLKLHGRLDAAGNHTAEAGWQPVGQLKLHGRLAPAGNQTAEVGWQPVGSSNASALRSSDLVRIARKGETAEIEEQGAEPEITDVLHLRSGDVIPCQINLIDESGVTVSAKYANAVHVPHDQVKAVELHTFGPSVFGFSGGGWKIQNRDQNAVKLTDERVEFHGSGTLGHETILNSHDIEFDLSWGPSVQAMLTCEMFAEDALRMGSSGTWMMYCLNDRLYVREQANNFTEAATFRGGEHKTHVQLSVRNKTLYLSLDGRRVLTHRLRQIRPSQRGISFTVQQVGAQQRGGGIVGGRIVRNVPLTISNFRVGRSGAPAGSLGLDDATRNIALTVPRSRTRNPFTHLIIAANADLVRGELLGMNADQVQFRSRLENFSFPRDRISGIVWLEDPEQQPEQVPAQAEPAVVASAVDSEDLENADIENAVQVTLQGGATLTLANKRLVDETLVGDHPFFGAYRVPLDAVHELRFGNLAERSRTGVYDDWKLVPAKEPQFAAGATPGQAGTSGFGMDSPLVGSASPQFTIELLDGRSVQLDQMTGQVIVLDFWATWCGPCIRFMPEVMAAVESFPQEQVVLIAVNQEETSQTIEQFLAARDWEITVGLDRDGALARKFQVEALPQTIVIGPEGTVQCVHIGGHPDVQAELTSVIQGLLDGQEAAVKSGE